MASDIWLRTILIVRKETRCRHIGYSYRLTARVLLYAPSHRQDNTYHGLCYTSRGALAGTRNSSMGPPHEASIRRPIAPWANALTRELRPAPDPLSTSSLHPVHHDCYNKGRDMCCPVGWCMKDHFLYNAILSLLLLLLLLQPLPLPGARCSSVVRAFAHWSILHCGPIELCLIPASAPRLWYVLSRLWDSAYKRTLAANRKE